MFGITIDNCFNNELPLSILLLRIGNDAIQSQWALCDLEVFGENAEELHRISDNRVHISGKTIIQLCGTATQIVEGTMRAYFEKHSTPWMTISAVDGNEWDLTCVDRSVFSILVASFPESKIIPGMDGGSD